ncbi:BON domain-containing protein [Zavarzinella formosa]|uniref:BON domain-containing protein n=1 Tax=Zavarzinella formosa TaxID=360055 RepID=UPI0002DF5B49|nr:BON domain-containing protein [Zavarzinella formosa]
MCRTISVFMLGLFGISGTISAAERPKDTSLSRAAYTALQADEELADLNLGVRVEQGGVAVIWGPVPSKQLMMKAEKAIEGIRGVTAIVNQCELTSPTDTFVKEVEAALKGKPAEPERPSAPVVLAPPPSPMSVPEMSAPPPVAAPDRQTVSVMKPKADFITTGNSPAPAEPVARLLEPEALPSTDADHRAIERLRTSDRRYADLRMELRDGRIVITGQAADPATAWELARRIAPFAGSRDIVVGRVTRR